MAGHILVVALAAVSFALPTVEGAMTRRASTTTWSAVQALVVESTRTAAAAVGRFALPRVATVMLGKARATIWIVGRTTLSGTKGAASPVATA